MDNPPIKRITTVKEHLLRVPKSKNNPAGLTLRRRHQREVLNAVDPSDLKKIFINHKNPKMIFPRSGKLQEFKFSDHYDELIAVWCDYFNKKFPPTPPSDEVDPDLIKALIASESGFIRAPRNPKAIGITQITVETLRILQNPKGEARSYLFKNISQKDLTDPEIAIPLAVRWVFRKRETATMKLKRAPTNEEIILEYKGLIKSKTPYKNQVLLNFKEFYEKLKSK